MSEEKDAARLRLENEVLSVVAEFMGAAVGMRPPVERHLFPPAMEAALSQLVDSLKEAFAAAPAPAPAARQAPAAAGFSSQARRSE